MHLHKIEMEIKLTCVIYEIFLIAYPNIYGSEYNWKSSDHPWNTLALSLTLHRQRRNFPYRQLVFTIQPFAFSPLIPLFLPFPLATVSLILPFVFTIAISRVCRRSNICIIGDDVFAVGTGGCSLNRNTLSRQITIRHGKKCYACLLIFLSLFRYLSFSLNRIFIPMPYSLPTHILRRLYFLRLLY